MTQVTGAMVEAALRAQHGHYPGYPFNATAYRSMRAALEAALAVAPKDNAERSLDRMIEVISYQLGQSIEDIDDPVATLDEIFYHKAAARRIERHGRHWFSDEDSERLHKAAYGGDRMKITHPLVPRLLAALSHCYTGEEFTKLMAEVILVASDQLNDLQRRILDVAMTRPVPQIILTDPKP